MTDIQKFYSDIQKIIKHDRADNNGAYDPERASRAVAQFFIKGNAGFGELPESITDYWLKEKVLPFTAEDPCPSEAAIDWLGDAQELLSGAPDAGAHFSQEDWVELRDMISFEAGELPVDVLTTMMGAVMEHGAL